MPPRDLYHDSVRQALVKDGWTITHDPFTIEYEELLVFADLGAEKLLAAERAGQRIAVEVKVFGGPSPVADLEQALGQYGLYRTLMKRIGEQRELFLAVSQDVFTDFFLQNAVQAITEDHKIKLLVFDADQEEIVKWIN